MELRKELNYWQVIDLPDGTITPGTTDHRKHPAYLNIDDPALLKGKRVVDIASNDGFWSFWAEQQGATDVLATDVERLEDYDWGYTGPPPETRIGKRSDTVFYYLHDLLNSNVRRETLSVYDHDPERIGQFDLVLCYGLIYHLRHPLRAIDALRRICKGACIIESHILLTTEDVPLMAFYEDDVLGGAITNWCGPTVACITHWMKSAGFDAIYTQRSITGDRQLFVGAVGDEWRAKFDACANLRRCDEAYFEHAHNTMKRAFQSGSKLRVSLSTTVPATVESFAGTPSELVRAYFEIILGRPADQRALEHYIPQIEGGLANEKFRLVLMMSQEYRERVLQTAHKFNDEKRLARFCIDTLVGLGFSRKALEKAGSVG